MKRIFKVLLIFLLSVLLCGSVVQASERIKIGVEAPITGQFAYDGMGMLNATKLIIEQYNAKGGVLGRQLEIVSCDDEGSPMKAAICAKDLVNQGVVMVVGAYTSSCALAVQETYQRANVLFGSATSADDLTHRGYWTYFRSCIPNSRFGTFAADYMVKFKKYKRIAIISDFSSYSDNMAEVTEESIKKIGGNVIVRQKIKSGTQNFSPVLTKIKSMKPDVIYFTGYYADGGILRAQQAALRIKADFIAGESNDNPGFFKLAGAALEGTYIINVPTPSMLPYEVATKFRQDYKSKFGEDVPSIVTLYQADALMFLLEAIKKVGSTDAKTVADYLHTLKDFPGTTGPITFDEKGERIDAGALAFIFHQDGSRDIVYPKQ